MVSEPTFLKRSDFNNWRKHREDRVQGWNVDPFSTGVLFDGWREHDVSP
jgi:hypothetical protein